MEENSTINVVNEDNKEVDNDENNITNVVNERQEVDNDEKDIFVEDDELYVKLLNVIRSGKNTLAQNIVTQSMQIEAEWIDIIENGLFSIEQIVKKPKTFIKEQRELLSVEKAKRVDSLAVRHLSVHTEFIKEILPDGTVQPSKVLTRQLEQDVAIYENRFVYALVKRLVTFIERRYAVIKEKSQVKDNTVLSMNNTFRFGKADVDYKLLMSVKTPNKNQELLDKNKELLERLELMRQRLTLIESTDFARLMKKEKAVVAPIQKTNILAGNVDYKNCYNLWIMLSRYNSVGYFVDIQKKSLPFDEEYFDSLTKLTASGVEAMMANNNIRKAIYQGVPYDRKIRKKFTVTRNVDYTVDKLSGGIGKTDNDISQYYFDKIKKLSGDIESLSNASDVEGFDDVKVNFRRYFKGLQRINNELYYDILKLNEKPNENIKSINTIEKYRTELVNQRKILKKYQLLTQLKKEEVRLSMRREETQEKKLKRMEKAFLRMEKRAARLKLAKEKEKLEKANKKMLAKNSKK